MNYVLDACAMIAYLEEEPGGEIVDAILQDSAPTCFAHPTNLCEVYYKILRDRGEPVAVHLIRDLFDAGVVERNDMDQAFWLRLGSFKARGRISLADCVCLSLAERLSATLLTSDHAEFDPIVPLGYCPGQFIR